jgi:hypothetical protein
LAPATKGPVPVGSFLGTEPAGPAARPRRSKKSGRDAVATSGAFRLLTAVPPGSVSCSEARSGSPLNGIVKSRTRSRARRWPCGCDACVIRPLAANSYREAFLPRRRVCSWVRPRSIHGIAKRTARPPAACTAHTPANVGTAPGVFGHNPAAPAGGESGRPEGCANSDAACDLLIRVGRQLDRLRLLSTFRRPSRVLSKLAHLTLCRSSQALARVPRALVAASGTT